MITKLNLEVEANKLAQNVNTKIQKDNKFELEYIIPEITEEALIEEGYTYIGFTGYTNCPIYQKENIYGLFIGNSFRLGEGLMTSEENYNKLKELMEEADAK